MYTPVGCDGSESVRKLDRNVQGVIAEGDDLIGKIDDPDVRDAAIIAAAQRVEQYEMAGYGTARTYAYELERMKPPTYSSKLSTRKKTPIRG